MNKRTLFLLFSVFLLGSCQPILRTVWGAKEPRYETAANLKTYLNAAGLSPAYSYTLDSLDWYNVFRAKDRTFPDLLLFDTSGNRISAKGMCLPHSQNFVDTLIAVHQQNFIKTNKQPTFQNFEEMFRDYLGRKVVVPDNNKYKAVIIWAVFIGKGKGLRQLKKIVYYVKHSKFPIEMYFLNVDLQTYWKKKDDGNFGKVISSTN